MSQNIISGHFNDYELEGVLTKVQALKETLPFLIDLTTEQRRNLPTSRG